MRLTISAKELGEFVVAKRFAADKEMEIAQCATALAPVAIKPVRVAEDRIISCVILERWTPSQTGKGILAFRPFWNRCYQVVDAKTKELKLIVIESELGKFQFTSSGMEESRFTTNGPGVGIDKDLKSQELFATLLETERYNSVVVQALKFIQGRELKKAQAA